MNNLSRNIAIAATLLFVGFLLYTFSSIVAYVLIAWVLSMVGQPLMRFFKKHLKFGKYQAGNNMAAGLTLLSYFIILGALIGLFVPLVAEQASNLADVDYGNIAEALQVPFEHLVSRLQGYGLKVSEGTLENQLRESLRGYFDPSIIGSFFGSIIAGAGNTLINLFSVVFITFFFLKEDGLFSRSVAALVPDQYEGNVSTAITDISRMLTRYFGGIFIQMTIITIFVSGGLWLLGVKNALLIGFFAALINVIPYVGPLIGAAFGVFITISSNLNLDFYSEMLPLIGSVAAVFAAMQMLDNFVLQPFIFSNSVQAHPLEIFIVILMGAQINGIVGMVLAIPAYTVFRVIARSFLSRFRIVQKLTKGMGGEVVLAENKNEEIVENKEV